MGRINGWRRVVHYSNLEDPAVEEAVAANGEAVIAAWRHEDLDTRLEYIYEPTAEQSFRVVLQNDSVSHELEGRYQTRTEGGTANKDLMRDYP